MPTYIYNPENKVLTCAFSGRLDTIASLSIQQEMNLELSKFIDSSMEHLPIIIVFDFEGATFISSSFIRICVNSAKQVNKGNFSIIHCDPFIKKTFKIAGLDEILNVS